MAAVKRDMAAVKITVSVKEPHTSPAKCSWIGDQINCCLLRNKRFFASKEFMKSTGDFPDEEIDYIFGQDKFVFLDDSYEVGGRCFCMDTDAENSWDVFQWPDYVTRPMVWCESCGARSIICIECAPEYEIKDGNATFIYPLVTIDKIINTQLYSWKWTKELYEKHFEEFIKIRNTPNLCYPGQRKQEGEFAKRIGLEPRDEERDPKEEEIEYMWEFAPAINSIDGQSPPLPLDMAHDGIYIFHSCHHDACGTNFKCSYWGD